MTDSERSLINEWIERQFENNNYLHCKRLKAWISGDACKARQKKYGNRVIGDSEGHLIPNPKIASCMGCEHMETELRRLDLRDIKSIMYNEFEEI